MFRTSLILFVTSLYLLALFVLAYYAERRERAGRSIVANPWVYALSMAVYCTSWTFYGSVGKAATAGLSFMTIYLGPTLIALLWWTFLRKVIRIARARRITTISDFIGSRYGNSMSLSMLVAAVVTLGLLPYLGLQMKAVIGTFTILTGQETGSFVAGWVLALVIAVFAMIFGVRGEAGSDKHVGLVFAVAVESIVKLAAFLAVGIYVSYGLFDGPVEILERIGQSAEYARLMYLGAGGSPGYTEWFSLTFLSMMAVMFLPRQFHVAVVENHDEEHVGTAVWLFPLYLFLINLFVLPVAFGGLLMNGSAEGADYFVLTIPMSKGQTALALLVFLGGFSAASSMLIVESLAISNMVMHNIVNPLVYKYNRMRGFAIFIGGTKRMVIAGLVLTGYLFAVYIGDFYSLVDMGLKSFEAVTILAPAFLLGLIWKGGNRKGAIAGIAGGFSIWMYTLIVPALVRSGILSDSAFFTGLMKSEYLNPQALFGLHGLDKWSHSLFWGMFFNIGLYVGVSVLTREDENDKRQALLFVDSYAPRVSSAMSSVVEIEDVLRQFLGREEAALVLERFCIRHDIRRDRITHIELAMIREEAERVLSGTIGATVAHLVLEERLTRSERERSEVVSSLEHMGKTLRLSRQELAQANRELALLKEFSESIVESIPIGVATLDERLRVRGWNPAMEKITGVRKEAALGTDAEFLIKCFTPDLFSPVPAIGDIHCVSGKMTLKGYVSRLTGAEAGYVVVLEDITERKKIEEELARATKHASIGRLAAGVSHEVGNPLASISSLVQEMQAENLPDEAQSSLKTVQQHIDRIVRIVRSLNDFARMSPRQTSPGSLKDALDSALDLVRYDRNFRRIEITADIGDLPPVRMDGDQMQQVFLNMLLNARDAMPSGGSLKITMRRAGDSVIIEFADTGAGIPPDIAGQIFDPFFTTKGRSHGTGLGLSISYSIIKEHGGVIEAVPGHGPGARFKITLPVGESQPG